MPSAEADGSIVPKRRNGKQQACEPCRKSKLRCDHSTPVCARCKRRRVTSECIYDPSPKKTSGPSKDISPSSTVTKSIPGMNLSLKLQSPNDYQIFAAGSPYVEKCPNGFLGPTAYSAIFLEHQGKLGMDLLDPCKSYHHHLVSDVIPRQSHDIGECHSIHIHDPNEAAIRLGMNILNALPGQDVCEKLLDRYVVFEDLVSHKPTLKSAHKSLWDTYGSYLTEPKDPGKLSFISEKLCRNAFCLPGDDTPKNRHTWLASFTGDHFRWEILGMLLALFGLAAISLPDWDPLLASQDESRNDRRKFACGMRDLVEACLLLCDHADNVSDLAVYLLIFSTTLQTYCETGKTSYLLWKRHGSLISSVTALGLHRVVDDGDPDTFMITELHKRQFIGVYVHDKTLSSLTGRPPLLGRRYSTCQLPLDLSDEQLMADEPELSNIKSKLDKNGWNTSGEVYASTWARALLLMNLIREEVLEISLSISNDCSELLPEYAYPEPKLSETRDSCSGIMRRCEEVYARMPETIRFEAGNIPTTALILPRQIGLHLVYLECLFLLERLSISRTHASGQRLVDLAILMLDDVLTLWAKRDWLIDYQWRFGFIFTMYGVPSAGVLCVELLKAKKPSLDTTVVLPRSEVIQKLSIFISCLEWARPTDETYTLCGHMHKVISHIMNQILTTNTVHESQTVDAVGGEANFLPDFPTDDDTDWLDWLNNVDWTKGAWGDFV